MQTLIKRSIGALAALLLSIMLLPLLPGIASADEPATVTLTVDGVQQETSYTTIGDALKGLKNFSAYQNAVITLDGSTTENVVLGGASNLTIQGGQNATLNGTINVNNGSSNITIDSISFISVLDNPVGYYDNDNAVNASGSSNLIVSNCTFSGYNYVSNVLGATTNTTFSNCKVNDCAFFLHSSDGYFNGLSVTDCAITGSENLICCSLLSAQTTISKLSGNTFTYANFGLQSYISNGVEYKAESLSPYVTQNSYANGYLADDFVNYDKSDESGSCYGETTLMTTLPEGASLSNVTINGEPIDAKSQFDEKTGVLSMSFSGYGVALGYNYNGIAIDPVYNGTLTISKSIVGTATGTDSLSFLIADENGEEVAAIPFSDLANGKIEISLLPGAYTVTEVGAPANCTTTVNGNAGSSAKIIVTEKESAQVAFVNTYAEEPVAPETTDEPTKIDTESKPLAKTGDPVLPIAAAAVAIALLSTGIGMRAWRKMK